MRICKQLTTLVAVALSATFISDVRAADHLDAPNLQQAGMGDRDINDLYAFQSPSNPDNTVLIMTVNPFAGRTNPAGIVSPTTFGTDVDYQIEIDNDNDAVPNVTFSTTFGAAGPGNAQAFTVTSSATGVLATGSTTGPAVSTGGVSATAGLYDDPFFFDLVGFNNFLAGTGGFTNGDTFAGQNVSAIVLEVPSTLLNGADSNIGVSARTVVAGMQVDRMGRPAVNTALIPSARKDEFNGADEANDDANFGADIEASIASLDMRDAGGSSFPVAALADFLVPDVLTLDTAPDVSGFPNGRGLADDVIDATLSLVLLGETMGVSDNVPANDRAFSGQFPYLASPNPIPEPTTIALAVLALPAILSSRRRSHRA